MKAKKKPQESHSLLPLRPGVMNRLYWRNGPPNAADWKRIRHKVLERDDYRCRMCGHRAVKYMNVHHLGRGDDDKPRNLVTCCVACHAVLHVGRNLALGAIQIWKSELSQRQIVQRTRRMVRAGKSLKEIKKELRLTRGRLPCASIDYANDLLVNAGREKRISLPEPYCAVFVRFKRWQIE